MKISVQAADVKTKLRVFSIEVTASEKDQMEEDGIVVRLRKVWGSPFFSEGYDSLILGRLEVHHTMAYSSSCHNESKEGSALSAHNGMLRCRGSAS